MLDLLPPAFTLADARDVGLRKDQVYGLLKAGAVERVARGAFVKAGELDPAFESLAAAAVVRPSSTMCLTSALVYYGLSDEITARTDIALPRGTRHPAGFDYVNWHGFNAQTFQIGREELDGKSGLFVYSAERTIVDSFRLAHREGEDAAIEALRRWLRQTGNYPARLLAMARSFPQAYPSLRTALEILG